MHFKLNGWQRLGIVLSALWAIWPFLYVGIMDVDLPEAFRNRDCYFIGFVPIPFAWLLAYIAVYTFKWVERGFQSTPAKVQAVPEVPVQEGNKCETSGTESRHGIADMKRRVIIYAAVLYLAAVAGGSLAAFTNPVVAATFARAALYTASRVAAPIILIIAAVIALVVRTAAKRNQGWQRFWQLVKLAYAVYAFVILVFVFFSIGVAGTNLARMGSGQ